MAPIQRKTSKKAAGTATRAWDALTPALSEWILEFVSSMGYKQMQPVQANTIPVFMGNKDVVVEAVTGSGKTLAYLIPVVERLLRLEEPIKKHHVGGIILVPTRELAEQIHSVLLNLLSFHAPSAAVIRPPDPADPATGSSLPAVSSIDPKALKVIPQLLVGGTSTTPQQNLSQFLTRSPNLLIGTPGRLLDLLSSPHVHCPQSSFEVLVIDEADRLLDMGFKEDLTKILGRLPKQRRTGLFSATVNDAVDQIRRVGMLNAHRVTVKVHAMNKAGELETEGSRVPASLQLTFLPLPPSHKLPALIHLLTTLNPAPQKSIIYLSTCASVDYFSHILPSLLPSSYTLIPLHGKQPPQHRSRNFITFTGSTSPSILLTTDLAARGIDIPSVDLTVQLDPPADPAQFLHRAGRAGRAGRRGLGVLMLNEGREAEEYPSFLAVRKTPVRLLTEIAPFAGGGGATDGNEQDAAASTSGAETEGYASATANPAALGFSPISLSLSAKATASAIRSLVLTDRALHEKAQRAFVSAVQAYSKHVASSIFRVNELDWDGMAEGWGLLRMPKMPELKGWKGKYVVGDAANGATGGNDEPVGEKRKVDGGGDGGVEGERNKGWDWKKKQNLGLDIDLQNLAYKDKDREKKRQSEVAVASTSEPLTKEALDEIHAAKRQKKSAWSNKTAAHDVAAQRRDKKAAKKDQERRSKMTPEERAKEEETRRMVEEVRKRGVVLEEEFGGFDD